MGNDAELICMDCDAMLFMGRSYRYNQNLINKKVPELLDDFTLIIKKFNMSLKQLGLFRDDYRFEVYDDLIDFLKEHRNHNVWLIDDFFEGKRGKRNESK